jgi:hypothetical protein
MLIMSEVAAQDDAALKDIFPDGVLLVEWGHPHHSSLDHKVGLVAAALDLTGPEASSEVRGLIPQCQVHLCIGDKRQCTAAAAV